MIVARFEPTRESLAFVARLATTVREYDRIVDEAMKKIADETVRVVKQVVETQNFSPLVITPEWAARKRRKDLDPRILIATNEYLDSMKVARISKGVYAVKANGLKASVLEEGNPRDKKKRPRRHWEPALQAMSQAAPVIFAQSIMKELNP